jgi:hypothetical protein
MARPLVAIACVLACLTAAEARGGDTLEPCPPLSPIPRHEDPPGAYANVRVVPDYRSPDNCHQLVRKTADIPGEPDQVWRLLHLAKEAKWEKGPRSREKSGLRALLP